MRRDGGRGRDDFRLGEGSAVDDVQERVDEQREPAAARVDDPGLLQHRQQVRGPLDGVTRRGVDLLEHRLEARRPRGPGRLRGLRRGPGDGQDRPLDRAHHRLVRGVGAAPQRRHQVLHRHRVPVGEHLGEAAQDLGEDHPRVAPGAHERPVRDRLAHVVHPVGVAELGAHRLERQGHVRARVPVGHRVDVEPVQLLLVGAERVAVADDDTSQGRPVEDVEHRQACHPADGTSGCWRDGPNGYARRSRRGVRDGLSV